MAETKTSPTPESFLKRSPLYLALGNRGAQFTEIDGAAVAAGFGDGGADGCAMVVDET